MPSVSEARPCLNRKNGTPSIVMLKGDDLKVTAPPQKVHITFTDASGTMEWKGFITWASSDKKYGVARLTKDRGPEGTHGPERADEQVMVSVEGSTPDTVRADLYTE